MLAYYSDIFDKLKVPKKTLCETFAVSKGLC